MYNWQKAVGVICPKDNMMVEPEFYEMSPDGISTHSTRLHTVDLDKMPEAGKKEAEILDEMGADVIVYACNASSFHDGPEAHERIRESLGKDISIPVTTASTAILEAIDSLGARELIVITPYGDDENDRLEVFLEGNGIQPQSISGLGLAADDIGDLAEVNEQTAVETYHRVVDTGADSADAVLIVSTNLASVEAIDAMEAALGVPVVSVNQAMFWHALRLTGIQPNLAGYGQLLR